MKITSLLPLVIWDTEIAAYLQVMTLMKIQSTSNGFDEELIFGNGGSGIVYDAGMSLNLVLLLVTIVTGLCGLDYFHNSVVV
ncbi:hypothetical protein L1987_87501 [Smallanthus sonchifolius]|nr:hypothetical protein L1987_87501 [Smallanthus sonchifolius]